jgi:hypothetical protein
LIVARFWWFAVVFDPFAFFEQLGIIDNLHNIADLGASFNPKIFTGLEGMASSTS